jgi:hypothetical protein
MSSGMEDQAGFEAAITHQNVFKPVALKYLKNFARHLTCQGDPVQARGSLIRKIVALNSSRNLSSDSWK